MHAPHLMGRSRRQPHGDGPEGGRGTHEGEPLGIDQQAPSFLPFLVVLHLGTVAALLLYFWRDWFKLIGAFFGVGTADERRSQWHLLWMIIPNKTTVYLDPQHSSPFVDLLKAHPALGPDLFTWAQQARFTTQDFYFPNDTHLSMLGQVSLGKAMLQEVRKRLDRHDRTGS